MLSNIGEVMKVVNPKLESDIAEGKAIKLDLGCGQTPHKGCYSVDHIEMDGVDLVADLNESLDLLPDDCVEYLYSRHAFEHVVNFLPLMREIHRITKPGAKIEVIVPHFSNVYGHSDPTHVRFFGLYSMHYFVSPENQSQKRKVPAFYTDVRFRLKKIKIEFYRDSLFERLFVPVFSRLVNYSLATQTFYERRLACFFHASQIRYCLEIDK